ncbi:glycosyltransferase [Candidatus Gottesmanbacteria bacterium]|nr:glycosyltransferase [Candidatus Gottesmanbacteria bacterium]
MIKDNVILLGGPFLNDLDRIEQTLPKYLSRYRKVHCFEYPRFKNLVLVFLRKIKLSERVNTNLTIFHSIGLLPFGRNIPLINKLNHVFNYIIFTSITSLSNRAYNIISFTPEISYLFNQLNTINSTHRVIYYVLDNYMSLPYWSNNLQRNQLKSLERKTLLNSSLVITASIPLYRLFKKKHTRVILYTTPAELSPFIKNSSKNTILISRKTSYIPEPRIGFIGSLYDWRINFQLLLKLLKHFHNISFVFLGTFHIQNEEIIKKLNKMKNFYFLGKKKYSTIPNYIESFKACIIPYSLGKYGKYAYPVKVNEYLCKGKPIVSTALPALKSLSKKKLLYWSKNNKEFIRNTQIALNEKAKYLARMRKKEAIKNSWQNRISEFLNILNT